MLKIHLFRKSTKSHRSSRTTRADGPFLITRFWAKLREPLVSVLLSFLGSWLLPPDQVQDLRGCRKARGLRILGALGRCPQGRCISFSPLSTPSLPASLSASPSSESVGRALWLPDQVLASPGDGHIPFCSHTAQRMEPQNIQVLVLGRDVCPFLEDWKVENKTRDLVGCAESPGKDGVGLVPSPLPMVEGARAPGAGWAPAAPLGLVGGLPWCCPVPVRSQRGAAVVGPMALSGLKLRGKDIGKPIEKGPRAK